MNHEKVFKEVKTMSGFDNILDGGSQILITPSDQRDRIDLQAIDQKTKEDLRLRHKLMIQRDWECNTIAYLFITNMCRVINSHILHNGVEVLIHAEGSELNFYDLFRISVTNKKNDNAEKTGNINVKFKVEKKVDEIIEHYEETDNTFLDAKIAYQFPDDEALTQAFLKIDDLTRRKAKEKYGIVLSYKWMAVAITYIFIENTYRYMIEKLMKTERNMLMVNFNDIIEFHIMREDLKIYLRPGYAAKLIVKSDESTESDNEDGDDY